MPIETEKKFLVDPFCRIMACATMDYPDYLARAENNLVDLTAMPVQLLAAGVIVGDTVRFIRNLAGFAS